MHFTHKKNTVQNFATTAVFVRENILLFFTLKRQFVCTTTHNFLPKKRQPVYTSMHKNTPYKTLQQPQFLFGKISCFFYIKKAIRLHCNAKLFAEEKPTCLHFYTQKKTPHTINFNNTVLLGEIKQTFAENPNKR